MIRDRYPNILMIMSDEQRYDVLGAAGDDIVRTPVLDDLADRGTYFTNCYCASPVCVPTRQAFHSGKLPRTIGCTKFGDQWDSDILTFPGQLGRYGYNTTAFGHMHFQDRDQLHGWQSRPMGNVHMSSEFLPPLAEDADPPGMTAEERREKGTNYFWGPIQEVQNARTANTNEGRMFWDQMWTTGACHYLDDYFANAYYDRMQSDEPLCLFLSLTNPHYPFQCPTDLFNYYLNRVEPYIEGPPDNHPCYTQYNAVVGEDVTERQVQRATAAYYGQVEFTDNMFGMLMDKMEQLNVLEDFIIIYFADHGEMLGQHGCWEKKQFHDGSARVPLMIYDPRNHAAGQRIDEVVSQLDLFPTVCDLAGVTTPEDLEGDSLVPLMRGDEIDWRDEAISELISWYHGGECFMIRRGHFKYVCYTAEGYPEQLFDMVNDPDETTNLIDDPDYAAPLAELRKRGEELPPAPEQGA
jgi:choline-sulfatase